MFKDNLGGFDRIHDNTRKTIIVIVTPSWSWLFGWVWLMAAEEASQRLLDDEESLLSPFPDHNPYSNDRQYGATMPRHPRPGPVQKPKRYRLPLLILISFDTALVVFLSIICYLVCSSNNIRAQGLRFSKCRSMLHIT